MAELKIRSKYPDSLKSIVESALAEKLRSLEAGIRRTEERILEFEAKYQLSTEEFLHRYENDEFQETLDLDEWIGEAWMLKKLQEDLDIFKGIELVIIE
jgi:hypothetical protein